LVERVLKFLTESSHPSIMLRSICQIVATGYVFGSQEVCQEEADVTSALQVSNLHERSSKRSTAVAMNMESVISKKGDEEVESSLSGKSEKSIASFEKSIISADASLARAKAKLKTQKDALKAEMNGVVDATKLLRGEVKDIAYQGKQLAEDATLAAFYKAERAVEKAEAKLQKLYDDVLIKYADKLRNAGSSAKAKAAEEIAEIKVKMNAVYGKVETLQDGIKGRLNEMTMYFYGVKDTLSNFYDNTLQSKFDDTKAAFNSAVDSAKSNLDEAKATAAEAAEFALVAALVPVVIVSEQMEQLGELVEEWRVKTAVKLDSFKESAQRQAIKAKEALDKAVGSVQEEVADFLQKGADKFESAKDKIQVEFDRQTTKGKEVLDDVKAKMDAGVKELALVFATAGAFAKDLKDNTAAWAKDRYQQASIYKQQMQDQLRETAEEIEELIVAQTAAAREIAERKYDSLKYQLSRAKKSASARVQATKDSLAGKVDEAQVVWSQAEKQADYAVERAKKAADDFAKAAVAAGKDLAEEAQQLIDEAVGIVVNLVEDPSDWATGTGKAGQCEEAKRYRFDTGSELKKISVVSSKESCKEKCLAYTGCAYWVRYQLSRDCHLFDNTAVVIIDRSWSNTPFGGPVTCSLDD